MSLLQGGGGELLGIDAKFLAWVRMGRLSILPGGILAYLLGAAMAYGLSGELDWTGFAAGLLVTEAANLAAHYADEYADVDTDTLTRRTWFSGGSGVLPAGLASPRLALLTALILAGLSIGLLVLFVLSGTLSLTAGWIAAAGLVGGWFYSMPPVAFERRGLGELVNGLLGGIIMPLMGYASQARGLTFSTVAMLLPAFAMVMAGLLPVHWADRQADAAVGRLTLALLAGRHARLVHLSFLLLAYGLTLAFAGWLLPVPVAAATFATLPLGLWAAWVFTRQLSPVPSSLAMAALLAAQALGWVVNAVY